MRNNILNIFSAEVTCDNAGCDPNAFCEMYENEALCRCNPGFTGDGFFCSQDYQIGEKVLITF